MTFIGWLSQLRELSYFEVLFQSDESHVSDAIANWHYGLSESMSLYREDMAVYQVRLVNRELHLDRTISVPDDQYILDIAEEAGIRLPAGCREGTCSSCIAKLVKGEVDQSEQKFLQPSEIADGYTVTCVAYPLSDCTLETHQEQVLYQSSLYLKPQPK